MPRSGPLRFRLLLSPPHILRHLANRLDAHIGGRRNPQRGSSSLSPVAPTAADEARCLLGQVVDFHLFPSSCRPMLAEHLPPHRREPLKQPCILDGEEVFADRSLLLRGESHIVHRTTTFRTRGHPAAIHSANSLLRHRTAPPRRTGAGARPLLTYRHQLRLATPAMSADSAAVNSSRRASGSRVDFIGCLLCRGPRRAGRMGASWRDAARRKDALPQKTGHKLGVCSCCVARCQAMPSRSHREPGRSLWRSLWQLVFVAAQPRLCCLPKAARPDAPLLGLLRVFRWQG